MGFKIYISLNATKFNDFKHIVGKREFLWANHYTKIFCSCVHSGAPDLVYPETSLYEHILWIHLEKNRTYARTFPVQRKEINAVVKVRFTIMYSSRKLNNKVITTLSLQLLKTNCLFFPGLWPHKPPKFLRQVDSKNTVLNFPLFFTWPTLTSIFQQFFRPLYEDKGQKITIFNFEYLGDACFNWAETSQYVYSVRIKHISLELN